MVLEGGILWRKGEKGKSARRVVPKKFRVQSMKLCHEPPTPPHWLVIRASKGLSKKFRYYWREISKDVSAFV